MVGLINILFLFFLFNLSTSEVVHLKGKLTCAGKGLTKASIELLEADLFEPDDLLGITNTDFKGFYEIKGEQNEWFGKIDPYLQGEISPATTTLNNSEIETTEKQKEEEGILITTTEINNNETKGEQVKQPPSTQPY
uniref:Transthyretin-like family-containing protein n=1 Tax=Meloidogyne javanica TaxID=6303 RepID=A0A915LIY8_MELJA